MFAVLRECVGRSLPAPFPQALYIRGRVYYINNKIDRALKDFKDALKYGGNDGRVHENLGYIYSYYKKQHRKAVKHLSRAVELGQERSEVWYYLTLSQWHTKDCDLMKSGQQYREKCVKEDKCDKKRVDWIVKLTKALKDEGTCN